MIEVSKLTTKVERLLTDMEKSEGHLDKLRQVYSRIEGIVIGAVVLIPICAAVVWWMIGGQLTEIRNALQHMNAPPPSISDRKSVV